MKEFKFEITLRESDVEGDEFWEEAIERDGSGIIDLTEAIISAIEESNLMYRSTRTPQDVIKLISHKII